MGNGNKEREKSMNTCEFIESNGTFRLSGTQRFREMYFPIASDCGLKSCVTPHMAGDAKLDQNHFVYEPVSSCDISNRKFSRNFWVAPANGDIWSATGSSAAQRAALYTDKEEDITVTAGYMWHEAVLTGKLLPIESKILSFVPVDKNMEIMTVTLKNTGSDAISFVPYAAIPLYGRSADNIRDHRHVTSLLHRISVCDDIIEVNPTLSFDERGHQLNDTRYFAYAIKADGTKPESFFVDHQEFCGCGDSERPEAVLTKATGVSNGFTENGQEAMGGFQFTQVTLNAGEEVTYLVAVGVTTEESEIKKMLTAVVDTKAVEAELAAVKKYWNEKVNVSYKTGDTNFDHFMAWISFQPELRRVFGCSFLPHHDYGKGGRGWRDLWQDCLALLLMNPGGVREMLVSNYAGVRIDGSNATIIGEKLGEFKADRNSITRVWMDHGVWPLKTTKLYIDQTGDIDVLKEEVKYFKDRQVLRGQGVDELWTPDVTWQQDESGKEYTGTILEHLLLQNLTAFWEVGEHNHIRLRDADWNDALDMGGKRGESVAFTNAYAQNLVELAEIIEKLAASTPELSILEEIEVLLNEDATLYEDIAGKNALLNAYEESVKHNVSGKKITVAATELAASLRAKGEWIKEHIRKTEWIDGNDNGWFNSYYDNDGNRLEGMDGDKANMMLTGQVFSVMAGTANEAQVAEICKAADAYLYDEACGGYRLNTDFNEIKTNMGRMFGFAFGEKENGAVFSHMAVMYANALYTRGFVKEGYKSLMALYNQSMNFGTSHIYPGIPEYFGRGGRGLYHYLTGAASWYMLTVMNEMFGVRGEDGNLALNPKLLAKQFDADGNASISFTFAGKKFEVTFVNEAHLEYGEYRTMNATLDGAAVEADAYAVISLDDIKKLDDASTHKVVVTLGK